MLFGGCNCIADPASLGALCSGGAGFVTAMMAAMAASSRNAEATPLGRKVPEVERLAVRMVTDNVVIQFVSNEKRGGLTIERRSGGNTTPDAPPRTALNAEWGLAMHAESQAGGETRNVLIDFGYTPEVLNNNLSILKIDPSLFDAMVLSHGHYDHFGGMAVTQLHRGQAQRQASVLCRRRGRILPAQECRRQFRRARPPCDHGRRPRADAVGRPGRGRRPCLHHRAGRPGVLREAAATVPRDRRHL